MTDRCSDTVISCISASDYNYIFSFCRNVASCFKLHVISGINIIGLRRRGFANEVIESIHNAYRIIYQSGLNTTEALKKIEDEFEKSPEIDYIIDFIRNSERGIIK